MTPRIPPDSAFLLEQHVLDLLDKGAVETVFDQSYLEVYSHLFLVHKKNGQLRPIINLRSLNDFLEIPGFQMEAVSSISAAVQTGD